MIGNVKRKRREAAKASFLPELQFSDDGEDDPAAEDAEDRQDPQDPNAMDAEDPEEPAAEDAADEAEFDESAGEDDDDNQSAGGSSLQINEYSLTGMQNPSSI